MSIGLQGNKLGRKNVAPLEQAGRIIQTISDGHRARRPHHANRRVSRLHHESRPSSHVTRSIRDRRRTNLSRATTARSSFGHYFPLMNHHRKAIRCTHEERYSYVMVRCSYARVRCNRRRCIRATRRNFLRCNRAIRCNRRNLHYHTSVPNSRPVRMSSYAMRAGLGP